MISHVDNPDDVEEYLRKGGSDMIILKDVETLLNSEMWHSDIKPISPLTPRTALPYLKALWGEAGTDVDNRLRRAAKTGLVYMIPYLMFREHASRAYTIAASESLWSAAKLGDAAMVDMLLRVGARIKDAGVPEQTLIDTLLKGGLLEKVSPEGKHYQRECDWPSYELTGRPMTYMTSMCKRVVSTLPKASRMYLPVLRYEALYYQMNEPVEHCGTFYYIDSSSSVLLDLGKTAVFGSKIHALFVLGAGVRQLMKPGTEMTAVMDMIARGMKTKPEVYDKLEPEQIQRYLHNSMESGDWKLAYDAIYPRADPHNKFICARADCIDERNQFIDTVMKPYYFSIVQNDKSVPIIPRLTTTPLYPSDMSHYWSRENAEVGANDDLDQSICTYAALLGIDTVILQHEGGEYNSVSEILDTRSNSYCHLVRVKDADVWYTPSKRYPTIWFTDDGFVTDCGITHNFKIDTSNLNIVKT